MNAEGRIVTAARWISGANGTLGGAAATTGLGGGTSTWQRATEADRAVGYAIKGVVMALDGRVNQRHNSRELAHHLQRCGEDVGMTHLDDVGEGAASPPPRAPRPGEGYAERPDAGGRGAHQRALRPTRSRAPARRRNRRRMRRREVSAPWADAPVRPGSRARQTPCRRRR